MDNMTIENAKYNTTDKRVICAKINGMEMHVPVSVGNRHYDEIKKQVDAGELTIEDAD